MNWTPIYAALSSVAALSGVAPAAIGFTDQPTAPTWNLGPTLRMQIRNIKGVGIDYEERVDVAPPNAGNLPQAVTVVGQRQFTWSIRCEVYNSDPATIAVEYLDALRTRLQRTTTMLDILQPAGLAIVDATMAAQQVPNVKNQRIVSTYVLDIVMACAENDVDSAADAGGFINTVVISSSKNPDGSAATVQLQTPDGVNAPVQINKTIGPA